MKYITISYWLSLLVFLFNIDSKAQEHKSERVLGVNASISFNELWTVHEPIYNYSVTASLGKHFVFAGPLFVKMDFPFSSLKSWTGVQAGYQFYPFLKDKLFIPYISYDINYLPQKGYSEGEVWNYGGEIWYVSDSYAKKSFANFISIGFQLHFIPMVYLNGSVGGGHQFYHVNSVTIYNHTDIHRSRGFGIDPIPSLYFKGGIRINFIKISTKNQIPKN